MVWFGRGKGRFVRRVYMRKRMRQIIKVDDRFS